MEADNSSGRVVKGVGCLFPQESKPAAIAGHLVVVGFQGVEQGGSQSELACDAPRGAWRERP